MVIKCWSCNINYLLGDIKMKEIYIKAFELYEKMENKLEEKEYQKYLINPKRRKK